MNYGCSLYGSACTSLLKRLDVLQNTALRICLGAMRSTPVDALYAEALVPPLSLRRQFLSEKLVHKIYINNQPLSHNTYILNTFDLTNNFWRNKNSPPLCTAFRESSNILPLLDNPNNYTSNYEYFNLFSNVPLITPQYSDHPNVSMNIINNIIEKWNNPLLLYTDASKSYLGTGCACYIPSTNKVIKIKLPSDCSIFTAEAIAIYEALKCIYSSNADTSIILSDSLSVLTSLENNITFNIKTNPYLLKIKKMVGDIFAIGKEVHFLWVKAHIGIKNNEIVDTLAKESINSGIPSEEKICLSDSLSILKSKLRNRWSELWQKFCHTNPTRYTQIHPDLPSKFWHENYVRPRKYITTIIRLKFGHACFPAHLFKIKVLPSENCDICNIKSDLDHIFFQCSKYKTASKKLYVNLIKCNTQTPFNVLSLLCQFNEPIFDCFIGFLEETKILL